ncbi:MAG: hypothetical protein K2K74_11435 [Lachnospiraceae bacterium]|nr:hypothetical protein [Lachnospiraceae bacterium]
MRRQIWWEYKIMWNEVTRVSAAVMCVVVVLHLLVYLNLQYRAIDSQGQIVEGLASYRALREAAEAVKGTMDGDYIKALVESYNNSFDKAYMAEHRGFLGTGGMTKYMVPNYFVNYVYFGPYMSNGNNKVGLDYDFLESEEIFYQTYRETVKEHLLLDSYTEEQVQILEKKISQLKTPFQTGYYQGLANLRSWFMLDYGLTFFALAFTLAGVFAADHAGGVTELTLSSRYGRKHNFDARWVAGNLAAVSVYLIFIAVQVIVNGLIATLDGWDLPAQMFWFTCLYNITVGQGLLIMFAGGLLGALVIGNMVILISIIIKNRKLAAVISVVAAALILRSQNDYGQLRMIHPAHFKDDDLINEYIFIGNLAVPYFVIVVVLTLLYAAVFRGVTKLCYRKYGI